MNDLVKRLRQWDCGESTWGLLESAANRIEKLERENDDTALHLYAFASRIEKLETALREIIQEDALTGKTVFVGDFGKIARKALDGKDDPQAGL
jgi:hypothetical protein